MCLFTGSWPFLTLPLTWWMTLRTSDQGCKDFSAPESSIAPKHESCLLSRTQDLFPSSNFHNLSIFEPRQAQLMSSASCSTTQTDKDSCGTCFSCKAWEIAREYCEVFGCYLNRHISQIGCSGLNWLLCMSSGIKCCTDTRNLPSSYMNIFRVLLPKDPAVVSMWSPLSSGIRASNG